MTTRAIKKLTKKDDLIELKKKNQELELNDDDDDGVDEAEIELNFKPKYSFNLLDELDEAGENDDENEENEASLVISQATSQTNKKKKKKKSKKNSDDSMSTNAKTGFEFKSSDITEEELLASAISQQIPMDNHLNRLFHIQTKFLSYDNEMVRMFGAKIVQSERQKSTNRNDSKFNFKNRIVNHKTTWPPYQKSGTKFIVNCIGLSMKILNETKESIEFTFEHAKEYQTVQFHFVDAVESLDHNNIIAVLHLNPYHIDSLIQLSEVSRVHDDSQMATDLIERAIYAFQNAFHPSFNFSSKTSSLNRPCFKFDYNRVENRGFFIVLFKQILAVGAKACYRTGLELAKLLYSLDLENDPLGVILLLDFFAIRSSEYQYLIDFYEEFRTSKHLNLMPNMSMSVALAYFYLYEQTNEQKDLDKANNLLQECLIQFPSLLMDMLEKCNVTPDKKVSSSWIFSKSSNYVVPKGLKKLTDLYVERMHCEWKIPENIQLLERNVNEILNKEANLKNKINENRKKCSSLFAKVPPNVYRHLILSDLKEVPAQVPEEYGSFASYSFDPVPPKNTIRSYTRPERRNNTETQTEFANRAESLTSFFQSLFPSFNADNLRQNQAAAAEPLANAAAANGIGMNQIVNRLREFLAAVELNFPAEPMANAGAQNNPNDEGNQSPEEFD